MWFVVGYFVVLSPTTNRPEKVDAVVVLGPPDLAGAVHEAIDFVRRGYAKTLLVSFPSPGFDQALCAHGLAGVAVRCFVPMPATTRGEARYIASAAVENGWKSVLVVTGAYHVARARMLIGRCFSGKLVMVGAKVGVTDALWRKEFFYETGGWAKALAHTSC